MARHDQYRNLGSLCDQGCCGVPDTRAVRVSYAPTRVTFTCAYCGGERVFYREPALEKIRTRAAKPAPMFPMRAIAPRYVAWVGYAKNPRTILLDYKEVCERSMRLLIEAVSGEAFGKDKAQDVFSCAPFIQRACSRQARYHLRGEIVRQPPHCPARGFWFRDTKVSGQVTDTVRCWTGTRMPGRQGSYLDGYDYDPPYLADAVPHQLYVVEDRWLVHPSDVVETM